MSAVVAPPPRLRQRLRVWRDAHLRSVVASLGRLLERPAGSLLTIGVLALAIALPVCLAALLQEAGRFSSAFRESRDLAVFLSPTLDASAAQQRADALRQDARVARVELRSPADGLAELRSMRDLGDALAALDSNPLPWVLVVVARAGSDDHALAEQLRADPQVDFVQHDAAWRERLAAWLALGRQLAAVATLLLGLGVVLVVGNTVRLDIHARHEEIATLRLLGASDGFVRRPFLYLGAWYGLLSGLLALALSAAVVAWLSPAVQRLTGSYGGEFALAGLDWAGSVAVLTGAPVLGMLGAYLAVGHYLRQAETVA